MVEQSACEILPAIRCSGGGHIVLAGGEPPPVLAAMASAAWLCL